MMFPVSALLDMDHLPQVTAHKIFTKYNMGDNILWISDKE
jgi:hypothetical protein